MYEIQNMDQNLAGKLLHEHSDMMFAGVVAGNNSGRVWVDDPADPGLAIVWSDGLQDFYFMGSCIDSTNIGQLKSFIDGPLINFLKAKRLNYFEFSSDREELYPDIFKILSDREIESNLQFVYKSKPGSQRDGSITFPESYYLHYIDRSFISSITNDLTVKNPEFLIEYINQFWGSKENFLNLGYGTAAVYENEIVSFTITSALYRQTFSLGVETLKQHRRKGLAAALAKVLQETLYAKGFSVWWDCMDTNTASQKTAESTGLIFDHNYKVCWFRFK